ncbi:MAG TPA: type IV toxin-antitoxin system AbiEi family antitoxin domain-containing protein [Solirubrobacteraceae bacterium]|nr:type IV toxin-antitoxin system AbiEi family antitoxin domain-containing protein [Solirubrobacteraceae bacterium]
MGSGTPNERVCAIAEAQSGRVSRAQLLAAGLSGRGVKSRVDAGLLTPEHRGVYAVGHAEPTRHSAEVAALLTRGPGTLICGARAAGLYGFRPLPEGVDILVPAGQGGGRRPGIRVHRSQDRARFAPSWVDEVPVQAPAWVLLELAALLTCRALELALDEAFATGRVNRDEVCAVVTARPNAPGAGTLRALLRARGVGNPSASVGQERLLAIVRAAGLPDPEMDAPIGGGFSADMLWPDAQVACEYDSFRWHATRSAWARDRRKDAHCRQVGVALVRVSDEDLEDGGLRVVATLARLIASRAVPSRPAVAG